MPSSSSEEIVEEVECKLLRNGFCITRMYWSWMTIVIAIVNGFMAVVLLIYLVEVIVNINRIKVEDPVNKTID